MRDRQLIERIKDALATAEDGEALIEVARNAHAAELHLSRIFRTREAEYTRTDAGTGREKPLEDSDWPNN